jgi:hypothetical protein
VSAGLNTVGGAWVPSRVKTARVTDLAYADVRPVLAKIADLDRDLVLLDDVRLPDLFRTNRLPQMRALLGARERAE